MHTSEKELKDRLISALEKVEVGGVYFHYKSPDKHYKVLNIAILEENEEPAVIYQSLYGEELTWIRAISSFTSIVSSDGVEVTRFQKVS